MMVILLAVVMVLLLPIIIPLAAFLVARDNRRMRRKALETKCLKCGHCLGDAAIERGEVAWRERMSDLHSGAEWGIRRRRIVRDIHAVCTNCGAAYQYVTQTAEFVLAPRRAVAANAPPAPAPLP
jgi:hypothetical protein